MDVQAPVSSPNAGLELATAAFKMMGEDTLAEGFEIAKTRREREPA